MLQELRVMLSILPFSAYNGRRIAPFWRATRGMFSGTQTKDEVLMGLLMNFLSLHRRKRSADKFKRRISLSALLKD